MSFSGYLNTAPVKRSAGGSAVAAAAYQSGAKLKDENKEHFYSRNDVLHEEMMTPENLKMNRENFWKYVENFETRKDARPARRIKISLPAELSDEENIKLAQEFVQENFQEENIPADLAVHDREKGEKNIHAHVLITERKWNSKNQELNSRKERKFTKKSWQENLKKDLAERVNQRLEKIDSETRFNFDHPENIPAKLEVNNRQKETEKILFNQAVDRARNIQEEYSRIRKDLTRQLENERNHLNEAVIQQINSEFQAYQKELEARRQQSEAEAQEENNFIHLAAAAGGAGLAANEIYDQEAGLEVTDQADEHKAKMIKERVGVESRHFIDQVKYVSDKGTIVLNSDVALMNYEDQVSIRGDYQRQDVEIMADVLHQRFGESLQIWGSRKFKEKFVEAARQRGIKKIKDRDTGEILFDESFKSKEKQARSTAERAFKNILSGERER